VEVKVLVEIFEGLFDFNGRSFVGDFKNEGEKVVVEARDLDG
jgi:hypothetical protein